MNFDVFSLELAEALFHFVDDEKWEELCDYEQEHDCSMAEFVEQCYYSEFKAYCENVYGFVFSN